MSRKYKFYDSHLPHFVSFATVNWVDLFTRREYVTVLTDSLSWCIDNKGLIVNAWCIMPSHVHLIIRSEAKHLSDILRDLKKYTSVRLLEDIRSHPGESRKDWLLWMFRRAGQQNSNNRTYQLWQQNNQPIELSTKEMMDQRLEYLYMNPVAAGFVEKPEDWMYSSARQYAGMYGLFELELIE